MPITWDDATDKNFLLSMINANALAPEKIPWTTILANLGDEYTMESIKSRYKKLKAQSKAQFGEPTSAGAATPKAKSKKADGEKTTGSKRKSAKKAAAENTTTEDYQDDVEQTPSKKQKVKKEAADEDNGDELV